MNQNTEKRQDLSRSAILHIPQYKNRCKGFGKEHDKLKGCKKCEKSMKRTCYEEIFKNFQTSSTKDM